jgi:hypothetical protein
VGSRNGVSTEKIRALDDHAKSPLFSDAEKAALEYADAITDTRRDVDDELFARLRHHYVHRGADDDHRLGERILALQPGVPHPLARVLEAVGADHRGRDSTSRSSARD